MPWRSDGATHESRSKNMSSSASVAVKTLKKMMLIKPIERACTTGWKIGSRFTADLLAVDAALETVDLATPPTSDAARTFDRGSMLGATILRVELAEGIGAVCVAMMGLRVDEGEGTMGCDDFFLC